MMSSEYPLYGSTTICPTYVFVCHGQLLSFVFHFCYKYFSLYISGARKRHFIFSTPLLYFLTIATTMFLIFFFLISCGFIFFNSFIFLVFFFFLLFWVSHLKKVSLPKSYVN
ncbi:unnamed protein product [Ixodes pacificus]